MYYKNCLGGYVLKFKREVELIVRDRNDTEDECTETVIKHVLMSMDLAASAYHQSGFVKKSPDNCYHQMLVEAYFMIL